ncbi:MAG: hypothetical protein WKF90_00430 [Pyrinomonadaceae bacterium]
MNWYRVIIFIIGSVLALMLVSSIIGIVYSVLWYLLLVGVLVITGFGVYQLFGKKDSTKLAGKNTVAEIDIQSARKALEKYKRRLKIK